MQNRPDQLSTVDDHPLPFGNTAHLLHAGELCQKGYSRQPDFEAHEGSYDHQHRKRLRDMRQLTKDPNAAAKARAAEQRANEEAGMTNISMPLSGTGSTSGLKGVVAGKKKPVFKSTLQPHNAAALGQSAEVKTSVDVGGEEGDASGAVKNGWFEERYQPRFVTRCDDGQCNVCSKGFIDLGSGQRDEVMANS